jgi:hypothetical protein
VILTPWVAVPKKHSVDDLILSLWSVGELRNQNANKVCTLCYQSGSITEVVNCVLFAILLSRFLLYEIRAATSFEVKALQHLQLLHTVPRWKKTVKSIISDNKLRKHMPCAKPEDILNANIQVIRCIGFRFLQH